MYAFSCNLRELSENVKSILDIFFWIILSHVSIIQVLYFTFSNNKE